MAKAPTITAGTSAGNDSFLTNEDAISSGTLYFNVVTNDAKRGTLYSLDADRSSDLLSQDGVLAPETSLFGASIWITAQGTIGYSMPSATVDSLAAGETIQDSFLYAIRQTNGSLIWQSVRVTITGTNDAPVARADVATVAEDGLTTGSVAANDSDVDNGALLSFATTSTAAGFAMAANGSWALDTSHSDYQALAAGETRQVVVNYTVKDQYGASSSSSLVITVTGTNDAPVATAATAAVGEDGSVSGRVLATDADTGAVLTYAVVGDAPAGLALNSDGTWAFDAADPAYQSLAAGEARTVTVNYSATDDAGASTASALTITVTGTNDGPTAMPAAASVTEEDVITGQLPATDPDSGDTLTYALTGEAPEGFFLNADGSWTLEAYWFTYQQLAQGEVLDLEIGYTVTDESGAVSESTLTIAVTGTNDSPAGTSAWGSVVEGETGSGTIMAQDIDHGSVITFSVVGEAPLGFEMAPDGSWTFDASGPEWDHLGADEFDMVQVHFAVTDEHGAQFTHMMIIGISGTNDAAVISGTVTGTAIEAGLGNNYGTPEISGQVAIVDVDGEDATQSMSVQTSDGGYGYYNVWLDGTWNYYLANDNAAVNALNAGQTLTDTFTIHTADGTPQTITITIQGTNDFSAPAEYFGSLDPNNQDGVYLASGGSPTRFTGTIGNDTIGGSWASDFIDGREGDDTLMGEDGNDQFLGGIGNDTIYGQRGGDILSGQGGDDVLWAGSSNDDAAGQDGNDILYGGSGWDYLSGGNGNDVLVGGYGHDNLSGGTGSDSFVFLDPRDTNDLIEDFQVGLDTLDFTAIDADPGVAGDQAFAWAGSVASAHSIWAVQQGVNLVLYADTDGDSATAELMVTLEDLSLPIGSDPFAGMLL